MTGEILDKIWSNFRSGKGIAQKGLFTGIPAYRIPCPAYGCNHCDHQECIYADFLRLYWNHPRCD